MAAYDLDLQMQEGKYSLLPPTDEPIQRMRNRFTTQFLSAYRGGRGSLFYSRLMQHRLRTNAAVTSLFALTAAMILSYMRTFQEDIVPERATLDDFELLGPQSIRLRFTLFSTLGSITSEVEVDA